MDFCQAGARQGGDEANPGGGGEGLEGDNIVPSDRMGHGTER